ncbi:hypothetical protein Tco_0687988 [Tanacetum coccineum]
MMDRKRRRKRIRKKTRRGSGKNRKKTPEEDAEENNETTGKWIMSRKKHPFSWEIRDPTCKSCLTGIQRIDTEGRIKRKFKEQDRHFVGLGCDNIEIDRTVRKTMSNLSGVKKLVKDLSDRFDDNERSRFSSIRKFPEEDVCVKSLKMIFLCLPFAVRKPPVEPFARSAPVPRFDDPYVVARDAAAAVTTSDSDDDRLIPAPMDSQPFMSRVDQPTTMPPKRSSRGDPPPQLTQDTVNRMIQESVEAAIRAERERVRNEANRAGGPNVAPVARECTFRRLHKVVAQLPLSWK